MTVRLALVVALLLGQPAALWADVVIVESTTAKAGNRNVEGVRTTSIKGTRMRIDLVQGDQTSATLYDLPGAAIVELDARKKRALIRDIAARSAQLEKAYPRPRTSTTVSPTGGARTISGSPCEEFAFVVRVPMTKSGETVLTLTGSAWIAGAAPGADDYQAFAQAANAGDVVIGYASDNVILLAITRGQTELYRALSALPGIPYVVDMTIGVDGKGMLAGMVRKVTSGSRTSTVTSAAATPLPDATFAIPNDWKREKK